MCQPFDYVLGENTTTGKLCSFFHEFQERLFALLANNCSVAQVNDELAPLEILASTAPRSPQFRDPGLNELSFDDQAAF